MMAESTEPTRQPVEDCPNSGLGHCQEHGILCCYCGEPSGRDEPQ